MSNRRELRWPNVQTNGTAKNFAGWDASQLPVEIPPASSTDILGGTEDTKPLTAKSFSDVRSLARQAVSVSAGVLLLNLNNKREAKFEDSGISSSAFAIQFTLDSNAEVFTLSKKITGTIAVTVPSSVVTEEDESRFVNGSKSITLAGGTGSWFVFSWLKLTTGLYEMRVSYKIFSA